MYYRTKGFMVEIQSSGIQIGPGKDDSSAHQPASTATSADSETKM